MIRHVYFTCSGHMSQQLQLRCVEYSAHLVCKSVYSKTMPILVYSIASSNTLYTPIHYPTTYTFTL